MKIDLSKEQGALVPLYFFRKPLGWPAEERPAAPDRRQTDDADRRQTDALNSLMKSRAQDTTPALEAPDTGHQNSAGQRRALNDLENEK